MCNYARTLTHTPLWKAWAPDYRRKDWCRWGRTDLAICALVQPWEGHLLRTNTVEKFCVNHLGWGMGTPTGKWQGHNGFCDNRSFFISLTSSSIIELGCQG